MQGADVIYATSWASEKFYENKKAEEEFKLELREWCVDEPWFENAAVDARARGVIFLNVSTSFADQRGDPQFTEIAKRIGLPQTAREH